MKTYCQNCDYPNDLGHLFCIKCGAKLVLENVREDLETDGMMHRTRSRFVYVALVATVTFVVLSVLALWPMKPHVRPNAGTGSTTPVDAALSRMEAAAGGGTIPFTNQPLREEDINAWLAAACARTGARSITVRLKPGECSVRVIFTAGPWKLLNSNRSMGPLIYSRDFACGVTSNGLTVTGAKVGHLPMVGPLVRFVAGRSAANFDGFTRERHIMSRVTGADIGDGRIAIAVMSRP